MSSRAWKSILEGRNLLRRHCMWAISNGENVRIFKDKWVKGTNFTLLHSQHENDNVHTLLGEDRKSWNVQKIFSMFHREEITTIMATPIHHNLLSDYVFWLDTPDDIYTVKSGYTCARDDSGLRSLPSPSALCVTS